METRFPETRWHIPSWWCYALEEEYGRLLTEDEIRALPPDLVHKAVDEYLAKKAV